MPTSTAEREWLEFVADLMAAPLTELPVEPLALHLNDTFDGVACAFSIQRNDGALTGRVFLRDNVGGAQQTEILRWKDAAGLQSDSTLFHFGAMGEIAQIQAMDLRDPFVDSWLRYAWFELSDRRGCDNQLALPLQGDGRRAFALGRHRHFSKPELELGRCIWRLLAGLDRQIQALARYGARPTNAADSLLTMRELSVLRLLADGLTAASIGRRLAISQRTVHKHLENIYMKLDVKDRLSAVLRAQESNILPFER